MSIVALKGKIFVTFEFLIAPALQSTLGRPCIYSFDLLEFFHGELIQFAAVDLCDEVAVDGREDVGDGLLPRRDLVHNDKTDHEEAEEGTKGHRVSLIEL